MDLVKLLTNPGLSLVNLKILNSLNYDALKSLCQVSKQIEDYIKKYCEKWKLLEILQSKKTIMKDRGEMIPNNWLEIPDQVDMEWGNLAEEQPADEFWGVTQRTSIEVLFERETFEYYEQNGTNKELALLLEFIQAYSDDEKTHHWTGPIDFAVQEKRIDFVHLMVPVPIDFEPDFGDPPGEPRWGPNISLIRDAVYNGDIEMVKILFKYSVEKKVTPIPIMFGRDRSLPKLATRKGYHKIAQLIEDIYAGRIDVKDLKPEIEGF